MMMMKSVIWWRKPEYPEETTDLRQVTDAIVFRGNAIIYVFYMSLQGYSGVPLDMVPLILVYLVYLKNERTALYIDYRNNRRAKNIGRDL